MKCPITKGTLEQVGQSHNGLVYYYRSTGNKALTFRRFRTEWSIIEMGKGNPRHFFIDGEDLVEVKKYGDKWLSLNATEEQISSALAEYRERLMKGFSEMTLPVVNNIHAKCITDDILSVISKASSGEAFQIQYSYDTNEPKIIDKDSRPDVSPDDCELVEYITGKIRVITADTIEADRKFFGNDVEIGDDVYAWDMGGWNALAGRAGEAVFRGNEYVTSKLTKLN